MRLVPVGASGYGDYYPDMLKNHIPEGLEQLSGVVDPFGEKSPWYAEIREFTGRMFPKGEEEGR